jgi:hypothetical protein
LLWGMKLVVGEHPINIHFDLCVMPLDDLQIWTQQRQALVMRIFRPSQAHRPARI